MIDQHNCMVEVFRQPAPLQQYLTCVGLDRSKLEGWLFLPLQNEDHRPVAEIAHAVEEDDLSVRDVFVHS